MYLVRYYVIGASGLLLIKKCLLEKYQYNSAYGFGYVLKNLNIKVHHYHTIYIEHYLF